MKEFKWFYIAILVVLFILNGTYFLVLHAHKFSYAFVTILAIVLASISLGLLWYIRKLREG